MPAVVSCIILTYNSRRHLERLLQSLRDQTYGSIELIVVDNASSDDTVEFLRTQRIRPLDQLICNPTNVWFAQGNNIGMRQAHGDYIYICNDDIELTPTFFERLVAVLQRQSDCGLVGGKMLKLKDGQPSQLFDSAGLVRYRSGKVVNRGENQIDHGQYDSTETVFGITGAGMMLRRSALVAVRYQDEFFDEDFVAYKEDIDLSWRIKRAGFTVWYEPMAVAYHARTVQQRSLRNRRVTRQVIRAYSYRNHIWTLMKNLTGWELLLSLPWLLPYECAKLGYIMIAEWSTVRSLPALVRGLPSMWRKRDLTAPYGQV